jgi:hypothetical protein
MPKRNSLLTRDDGTALRFLGGSVATSLVFRAPRRAGA